MDGGTRAKVHLLPFFGSEDIGEFEGATHGAIVKHVEKLDHRKVRAKARGVVEEERFALIAVEIRVLASPQNGGGTTLRSR